MRRLMTFFMGMVTGGALLYTALNYHLIRARDGMHLIPKASPRLAATYVDIRNFRVADWAEHADIAAALINADRRDVLGNAAVDSLQNGIDLLLDGPATR